MKISLIYPVWKDEAKVPSALQDISSFFAKFQIPVEIVLVFDPPFSKKTQTEIEILAAQMRQSQHISLQVLWNDKTLYRGGSIARGLAQAHGDVLIAGSIDLSTPLSEIFPFIQEFVATPDQPLIVLGQRPIEGRKKYSARKKHTLHQFVDQFVSKEFKKMVPELGAQVPSTFALNRAAIQKLKSPLKNSKWYYILNLVRAAHENEVPWKSLDVLTIDKGPSHFSIFRWI